MGGDGCEYKGIKYKVKKVDVKDSSGAGDSFLSALVVKYLESNDIIESIKFANKKASKVVTQVGVGII
jgi:sugar/nucleoside kinase (ribokinase family)